MEYKIRIGTRKSPLALWQANWVADRLKAAGANCELVKMDTKGDRMLNVSIPEIGSKGVFTEDLERALSQGNIDLAVHSAKDMPSELPEGFELIAFTLREQPHDVLVSDKPIENINSLTIGTSSVRRVAILRHYFPGVRTLSIRGNLQTRISKLESEEVDAVMLAYAGVERMGLHSLIKHNFPVDQIIPAVGQGSMAIETSMTLDSNKRDFIRKVINHQETEMCILAERAFLNTIEGGCSIPAFAYARFTENEITITGGVISIDGTNVVQFTLEDAKTGYEEVGQRLGRKVLNSGGKEILDEVRNHR